MRRAAKAWVLAAGQLATHPAVRRAGVAVARETGCIGAILLLLRADLAAPVRALGIALAGWRLTAVGRRWNKSLAGAVHAARHRQEVLRRP